MGYLGNPGHAEVQAGHQGGGWDPYAPAERPPAFLATSVPDASAIFDWGYQFVACNVDVRIFVQGLDGIANRDEPIEQLGARRQLLQADRSC